MTDAPERIWISHEDVPEDFTELHVGDKIFVDTVFDGSESLVEYVRADLFPAAVTMDREAIIQALAEAITLMDELCEAVDCEAADIGGQRGSLSIVQEIGPKLSDWREALDASKSLTPAPVAGWRDTDSAPNSPEDQAILDRLAEWVAGADNPDDPSPVKGSWISELLKILWVEREVSDQNIMSELMDEAFNHQPVTEGSDAVQEKVK